MRFLESFDQHTIVAYWLVFLHLDTEITVACKILSGGEIKKITVDSKLICELPPYEVEVLISKDMI